MSKNQPIMLRSWPRAIVHIDGDAFFASCEQAIHSEYRGKPVVTGKERGIVAAASYEAKARGVSRGTPLWEVKKLCPDAIIVPSDYETYSLFSKRMFEIMRRYTSLVEEYSIDEAFAEITGLRRPLRASYVEIARKMKHEIDTELGFTVSVGIAPSKTLAKVGSKWNKPSGCVSIPGRKIHEYLVALPLEKVWGIGPQTTAYCGTLGMKTALDFARKDEGFIRKKFTKPLQETWEELNGRAVFNIETELKTSYASISKTKTFTPASTDKEYVWAQLLKNVENACIKARRHSLLARGIIVYLKTQEFRGRALEARFSRPTAFPLEVVDMIRPMYEELFRCKTEYRATGAILTGLTSDDCLQMSLFDSPVRIDRYTRLYKAMDDLAATFGKHCVFFGASMRAHKTPQHVMDRGDVPERKLTRLKGESERKHLKIPMLMGRIK